MEIDDATQDAIRIMKDAKDRMEIHTPDFKDIGYPLCGCELLQSSIDHIIRKFIESL